MIRRGYIAIYLLFLHYMHKKSKSLPLTWSKGKCQVHTFSSIFYLQW